MASKYNTTISFGGLTFHVDKLTPVKVNHTDKTVIGGRLIKKPLPGTKLKDWSIVIMGKHVTTSRHDDRETLEGFDDNIARALVDGIHDGNYFIERLPYVDDKIRPTSYAFTLQLIQDQ